MKTAITEYKNNCVLVAFKQVSNLPDPAIIDVCQANGFKGHGMHQSSWLLAAATLGIELDPVYNAYRCPDRGFSDPFGMTIAQFAKKHRDGTFLVQVRGHLLTMHDGKVIDPNYRRRASRRRVHHGYRVMNSTIINTRKRGDHLPKDPQFYFINTPNTCARRGSVRWDIYITVYREAMELRMRTALTLSTLADVGYTRKMLRSDLRKGNVGLIN